LRGRPGTMLLEPAFVYPVDREVRARLDGRPRERAVGRIAERLQRLRRHPASAGEQPRPDHAPRVEVVALVPAVVRDLMAAMGIDEGEQHAADLDRILLHAPAVAFRGPRSPPAPVTRDDRRRA